MYYMCRNTHAIHVYGIHLYDTCSSKHITHMCVICVKYVYYMCEICVMHMLYVLHVYELHMQHTKTSQLYMYHTNNTHVAC